MLKFSWRLFGAVRKTIVVFLLISLLALNAATLIFDSVFGALSSIASAVTDGNSVRDRQQSRLEVVEKENAKLRRQQDGERRVRFKGKHVRVHEAVSETAHSVQRRVSIATARNIAATPGEALPFFGVAVIAAATAWEVRDACATIEELYELDVAFNPENAIDTKAVCGKRVPTKEELLSSLRESPSKVWSGMQATYDELPEFSAPAWYGKTIIWAQGFPNWDDDDSGELGNVDGTVE